MPRLLVPPARLALNALLIAAGVALFLWLAVQLRLVVLPVLLSILLATLLVPPADWLRRRRVPSVPATLAVMAGAALVLAGAVSLVVPAFADQFDELSGAARDGLDEAIGWLTEGPLGVERAEIDRAVESTFDRVRENSSQLGRGLVSGAVLVAEIVAGILLAVVLLFFFVHDGRGMWRWSVGLWPERRREDVDAIGRRIWTTLAAYVRGVAVVAVVDALLIGLALVLIGVPLVVPLMVVTFLGAFVPLVGAVLAGAVAALVALVTQGVLAAVLVVVAITVIQQLEGDLLYPVVVGRAIALHPVAFLLALTAGSVLAGVIGALLAVPVAAAVWTAVDYVRGQQGSSPPGEGEIELPAGAAATSPE
jgi:predicted PurR-regulated permease PerM